MLGHGNLGFYELNCMPFGLCNVLETFLMKEQLQHCQIYLDDIIVFSETFESHISRLDAAFQLKANNCEYVCKEVTYLGHIVSENGIKTEWEKIKVLQDWSVYPIQCMEFPPSHLQRSYKGQS